MGVRMCVILICPGALQLHISYRVPHDDMQHQGYRACLYWHSAEMNLD